MDTPETDKAERMAYAGEYMVPTEFARKLERERDEAIAARKVSAADWLVSQALQQVALAERERDEALANIMQMQCHASNYFSESEIWKHKAAQLAEDILLDGHASSRLIVKASKIQKALEAAK